MADWQTNVRTIFNSVKGNIGQMSDASIAASHPSSIKGLPTPGVARREAPTNVPIKGPTNAPTFSQGSGSLSDAISYIQQRGAGVATPNNAPTLQVSDLSSLVRKGTLTLGKVGGEVLNATLPSKVVGAVKSTVVEGAKSLVKILGATGAVTNQFLSSSLFRKAALGQHLTQEEWLQFNKNISPQMDSELKALGFDTSKPYTTQMALTEAWNAGNFIALAAPIGEGVLTAAKGLATGGKIAVSEISAGLEKSAIDTAIKEGRALVVDEAGNVFANKVTSESVSYFAHTALKELSGVTGSTLKTLTLNLVKTGTTVDDTIILKTLDAVLKPLASQVYKAGMYIEAANVLRKYIDPIGAEKLYTDQRQFTDSMSTGMSIFLDGAMGLWIPFEIFKLPTVRAEITGTKDIVQRTIVKQAFGHAYTDAESLAVLDRLSQFRDLSTGRRMDIGLESNLAQHMLYTIKENGRSVTVDHVLEAMKVFTNDPSPEIRALIKSNQARGVTSHLSWYSDELGRALTPSEQLMHWFVTETKAGYIGDLGPNLASEFEKAIALRTTGIDKTVEIISKEVSAMHDMRLLAPPVGSILTEGEGAATRMLLDTISSSKADLLIELQNAVRKEGVELIRDGEKLVVPTEVAGKPAIKKDKAIKLDQANTMRRQKAPTLALASPWEILQKTSSGKLLDYMNSYSQFQEINATATVARDIRSGLSDTALNGVNDIKRFFGKAASQEKIDKLLTNQLGLPGTKGTSLFQKFQDIMGELRSKGGSFETASDGEILDTILGLPSKLQETGKIPKDVSLVLSRVERETLKANDAISNFDKMVLANVRDGKVISQEFKDVITETRNIEAQLPRGAFAPEYMINKSRWETGVTHVPLADFDINDTNFIATSIAKFEDSSPIAKAMTDYLSPHNPTDIYARSMNKLSDFIAVEAPGTEEFIMRDLSIIQDKGISILPILPGGGPKLESLGKPMLSGITWKEVDAVGLKYGVKGLGHKTREVLISSAREMGIKPFITESLRSAPGIGPMYDALYRQYMTTRFALNPIFHAQQLPEVALLGIPRSFNLPAEMSGAYIKSILKLPVVKMSQEEARLYEILGTDLFSKTAKSGEALKNIEAGLAPMGETRLMGDVISGSTLEERKRLRAFIAEFPVRVRGELSDMPALRGADPLAVPEYASKILDMQGSPAKMESVIKEAFAVKDFEPWAESIKRAVKSTNKEVQTLVSYNGTRSGLEKDLHAIFFPFSYAKKVYQEVGRFATGGSVARVEAIGATLTGLQNANDSATMQDVRARYPTMTGWIYNMMFGPVNPAYPVVDLPNGSIGLGALKATPIQNLMYDTFVDPEGKYNVFKNPTKAIQKFGGGGSNFYFRDLPRLYNEIFKGDTPAQQQNRIYLLNRMQLDFNRQQLINGYGK